MVVINEPLLDSMRCPGNCSWCGRRFIWLDPHHIFSRGAGRIDVAWNVLPICRECHTSSHAGHEPTRLDLLAIAAARHKCLQDDILEAAYWLRRADKHWSAERFEAELGTLKAAARRLVDVALEAGK